MNQINRPLFLNTRRRRAEQFVILLLIILSGVGTIAVITALFFGLGALISSS